MLFKIAKNQTKLEEKSLIKILTAKKCKPCEI